MSKQSISTTRGAGILLPVSSLPSNYGIGTFGKEAYNFIDLLVKAKQKYWQVLPIGPTSYGDSPYQSFSAFSGNPYLIDLDMLIEEGLLKKEDVEQYIWFEKEDRVDYGAIFQNRFLVLRLAFKNSKHIETKEYKEFCEENQYWLSDYSLYMALKTKFNHQEWSAWDEDIRNREESAIKHYEEELKEDINFWKFCQFKFRQQWKKLKDYANEKGIRIIGDVPLYMAMDSVEVWVHGRIFQLDERKNPTHVAGVPPDGFSPTGQRWGNPLYDWDVMEKDNFSWWRERMKVNAELYDIIRIDHFIGIVRYFKIPASCPTAEEGKWVEGPGKKLTDAIKEAVGDSEIIAEDLGIVVDSVRELINETGWPGMKVMEFAFDSGPNNDNLPHHYRKNSIVYGGTHDNETLVGYFANQNPWHTSFTLDYLGLKEKAEIPNAVIRAAYASVANTAIFQMQDILGLDNEARMNFPGTFGSNWQWRMKKEQFEEKYVEFLRKHVEVYGRC